MHPYQGITAALPTLHGKERVFAPIFKDALDIEVIPIEVNTDLLGTFSGEIERLDDPSTTSIKKTDLARDAGFGPYLLASEGSIGNHPTIPLLVSDTELVIFRDVEEDLIIEAVHISFDIKAHKIEITPNQNIDDFLVKADFPRHALIVKGKDLSQSPPIKGVRDPQTLDDAIKTIARTSPTIIVENDFRAHQSPTRMANIGEAAKKLAARITQLCPSCNCPGFGAVGIEHGVRCAECGRLNADAPAREVLGCYRCPEKEIGTIINHEVSADRCIYCNP